MPTTEHDPLGPQFDARLKSALDRITPPASVPRYASMSVGRLRTWRVAPFLLGAATAILLALTATATTGSPNPAVWTGDAASAIGSVAHTTEASPSPSPSPEQSPPAVPKAALPVPSHEPEHEASPIPQPSEHSGDSGPPQPSASPSPSDDHSDSSSPSPSPSPSPGSDDH